MALDTFFPFCHRRDKEVLWARISAKLRFENKSNSSVSFSLLSEPYLGVQMWKGNMTFPRSHTGKSFRLLLKGEIKFCCPRLNLNLLVGKAWMTSYVLSVCGKCHEVQREKVTSNAREGPRGRRQELQSDGGRWPRPAGHLTGPATPQFPQRLESHISCESLDLKNFLSNSTSVSHRADWREHLRGAACRWQRGFFWGVLNENVGWTLNSHDIIWSLRTVRSHWIESAGCEFRLAS